MLRIESMSPVLSIDVWTSGADVSPPATTVSFSALLSLTDLEESSDISGWKESCEAGYCLNF